MNNIFYSENRDKITLRKYSETLFIPDDDLLKVISPEVNYKNDRIDFEVVEYRFFKDLRIQDIQAIRKHLEQTKRLIPIWNEKILRYSEVRLNSFQKRLKQNLPGKNDRIIFTQIVISFLLESFYYSNDYRFLNIAIKMLEKQNSTNLIGMPSAKGYNAYNRILANYLINS